MKTFTVKPEIHQFPTCEAFAREFSLGEKDVIITNEYIYHPMLDSLGLNCKVIFQEKYGLGEPSDDMVEAMYRDFPTDCTRVIAIGGGTILDIAKLFVLKNVSPVLDLYDGKVPVEKCRELVLVPTTCGTGSEVTNISILALNSRGTKKGLANDEMYADYAVLIPELLKSLPFPVFATSSIDALIHGIESVLSPKANDFTKMFGYRAIEMIISGYKRIIAQGKEVLPELLEDFLLASNFAGISFGNAGCAAVHALSYPLGSTFHIAHGESNYVIFIGVMRNYLELKQDGEIALLCDFIGKLLGCDSGDAFEKVDELLGKLLTKKSLSQYGLTQPQLEEFTDSVLENQQRLLANNFVPLDRDRILKIYKELY